MEISNNREKRGLDKVITIIVPVYNSEQYLSRCIESILNQTYTNFELLLVNDGSNDASLSMCEKYATIDNRIKIISTENNGVSSARNTGLDASIGTYIGFVDSDDWIEPDMFEILIENAENYKADISCCNYFMNSTTEIILEHQINDSVVYSDRDCADFFLERKTFGNSVCNKVFNKKIIKHKFDLGLSVGEDAFFLFEACLNSKTIVCCKEAKYHYYIRIGSATKIGFNEKVFQMLKFTDMIIEEIKKKKTSSVNEAYAYAFTSYFSVLNVLIYHRMEKKYKFEYEKVVSFLNLVTKKLLNEKKISKAKLLAYSLFYVNKSMYRYLITRYYKNKKVDFMT
ncbi:glycosyltransferase family 2 protein [Paenibacillus sp. FSL H7-0918]|uniref:glycosyltransferase family 2 protein n=1 Tax=Paenibacillus sp. FSL H7-0918 TaxID=2921442 RepID=UPI0030F6578F